MLFGSRHALRFREVIYLAFQGNIKGGIALAFIIKFKYSINHKEVVISTMMTLVVATVLIYGSFMPLMATWLLGDKEDLTQGMKRS